MSRRMNVFVSIVLLSVTAVAAADEQELELAAPFTNNMVLQRQTVVPVWGFDMPDAQVTVEFAGQKKTAVADKYGDWMVKLDPVGSKNSAELQVQNASRVAAWESAVQDAASDASPGSLEASPRFDFGVISNCARRRRK